MTQAIFKYDLEPTTQPQCLTLSKGARVLSTGFQVNPEGRHVLRVWVIVEPFATEHETVVFWVLPTGLHFDTDPDFKGAMPTFLGRAEYPDIVVHVFFRNTP